MWLDLAMVSQALVSCFGLGGPTVHLPMSRLPEDTKAPLALGEPLSPNQVDSPDVH